jgi:glycosyltransferase involved in cell wall biosynthesis
MFNIIYADDSGGVKTVSESLYKAFGDNNQDARLINLNDFGLGFIPRSYNSILKLKRLNKNSVLIFQHFFPVFVGMFLHRLGFKRIINVIHIDLVEYYKSISLLKKIVIRFMFYNLKHQTIVFVSKEAELKARCMFKLKNTHNIYNIYNIYNVPSSELNKVDTTNIRLGSISRLHAVKNIDLLIRVFKKVKFTLPNIELLIYGSGDQQEDLEKYIKSQGCSDKIKLLGVSNDKQKMYSSIDAMVSFSSIEGLPTAILESIGFQVPILYTDCSSGPRELMSPNSDPLIKTNNYEKTCIGYLVKPTKNMASYLIDLDSYEEEYVDIMLRFIDDVQNDNFSMEYDPSRFSGDEVVRQWLGLIASVN